MYGISIMICKHLRLITISRHHSRHEYSTRIGMHKIVVLKMSICFACLILHMPACHGDGEDIGGNAIRKGEILR